MTGGRVTGRVHLETTSEDRGFQARVAGFLEMRDGNVSRFDLVARGPYGDHSEKSLSGRYPLAVALTLAPADAWRDVLPLGIRDLTDYMR